MHSFLEAMRIQRWDDHRYYHHSRINQSLHLVSAISFLCAYALAFSVPAKAALIGWLIAMPSRQIESFRIWPSGRCATTSFTVHGSAHVSRSQSSGGRPRRRAISSACKPGNRCAVWTGWTGESVRTG